MEAELMAKLANEYVEIREQRIALGKQVDFLKLEENELKHELISAMHGSGMGMVAGTQKKVTLRTKNKPVAADWQQVEDYVVSHACPQILQRRLAEGVVKEMLEGGEIIPSVILMEVNDLSVSKI